MCCALSEFSCCGAAGVTLTWTIQGCSYGGAARALLHLPGRGTEGIACGQDLGEGQAVTSLSLGLVEGVPACGRGLDLDGLLRSLPIQTKLYIYICAYIQGAHQTHMECLADYTHSQVNQRCFV